MSMTTTTITASPTFDDYYTGKQKLVLNVEMSFIREQLISQSTRSRTVSTKNVASEKENNPKPQPAYKPRKKVNVNRPVFRRVHPLDIFFKAEDSLRKSKDENKYKSWNYYADRDFDDYGNCELGSSVSPKSKVMFPEINEFREEKNVSFDLNIEGKNIAYNKLPEIEPESREMSALSRSMANECDVLFYSKTPPSKANKRGAGTKQRSTKNKATPETDIYSISFRPNSRGNYDPNSELRSSYYTIKRVDSNDKTLFHRRVQREKPQTPQIKPTRPAKKNFHALMVGTQKLLHRKNQIECDGYQSVPPIDNWSQTTITNLPGFSSVPLHRYF